jgi:hypothetical protein
MEEVLVVTQEPKSNTVILSVCDGGFEQRWIHSKEDNKISIYNFNLFP